MTWRREVLNKFNKIEPPATGHVDETCWLSLARVVQESGERRFLVDKG